MLRERNDLADKVESIVAEKKELIATVAKFAKVITDLQAWLKEFESKLGESELKVSKEREASK